MRVRHLGGGRRARGTRSAQGQEESLRARWHRLEPKALVERARFLILGVDDYGVDGKSITRIQHPIDGVGHKDFAESLASKTLMACKPTDEHGGDCVVAG